MREEEGPGGLPEELRELGRSLRVPDVDGESMAERVLAQLLAEHAPGVGVEPVLVPGVGAGAVPGAGAGVVPGAEPGVGPEERAERWAWLRRRWRALLAALSGVLVVAVLTPPVRAAVVEWLGVGVGGVAVEYAPGAPPVGAAEVPGCPEPVPPAEAARRAGFAPLLPEPAGAAPVVSVSVAGSGPRVVVGVCWRTAEGVAVRLDQFAARLDPAFEKTVSVAPEPAVLPDGTRAYWFAASHRLAVPLAAADGSVWSHEVRAAGPTLLWVRPSAGLTLRLEGIPDRAEALRVAASVR
ncbi:hypothetical protein ACFWIN_14915 [Streptomyces sp. NPDC127049]|uniref:hypothetical protein n=1 Tax=Streptomyces sp. NPDC127049 TaxID=3347118 RepID=UPI00365BF3B9